MWQNMSILMVFMLLIPGSISQSRSSMEETYAEVIIDDQTYMAPSISKIDITKQ